MEKIQWKNEKRKVADLLPASYNPRKITEKEKNDLTQSIKKFDEVEPVIINTGSRKNVLIGGHQRIKIYADIGREEIDVRVPSRELSIEEETELNIRLNKNTGQWDWEKLKEFDIDKLLEVGFDNEELSDMWNDVGTVDDGFGKDEIKKVKTTNVQPGDIYKLGEHRLMCGDSTDTEQVKKLMGGEKADMIYCDPPYNIGLDYKDGIGGKGGYSNKEVNDNKSGQEYNDFINKTLENAIKESNNNVHIFYWCDEKYIGMVQNIYNMNKIDNKRVCLWVKNNQNPTPHIAFNKVYEPCVYGTIGKPYLNKNYRAFNEVINQEVGSGNQLIEDILDLISIWLVSRDPSSEYEHPTQKPLTLNEKPIKRCTSPGSIVVDLFGGSGSTLIACEQLKRKCYTMELDPIFCQVIINRYEQITGDKAVVI